MKKQRFLLILTAAFFAAIPCFAVTSLYAGTLEEPCTLFTRDDAISLFNEEDVSEGVARVSTAPAGKICKYTFKHDGGVFGLTFRVCTTEEISGEGIFGSAADVFTRQENARKANEEAMKKYREVDGIGEGAFWDGTSLWVLDQDVLFIIKLNSVMEGSFSSREDLDAAVEEQNLTLSLEVAETLLSRLGGEGQI